ncbi:hypothetical protein JNO12_04220 [Erwinia aphidicola]|nr:hypothetical protein [Erwinia aphidicola]
MSYLMKCYGLIAAGVLLSVSAPGFAGSLPADKCYFYKKDSSGNNDYTADQVTAERTWGTGTIPRSAAVGSRQSAVRFSVNPGCFHPRNTRTMGVCSVENLQQ